MKYLGRSVWEATAEEIESLPSYHEASRQHGYSLPLGLYKTVSASTHEVALVEVVSDPLTKTREVYSHVKLVKAVTV